MAERSWVTWAMTGESSRREPDKQTAVSSCPSTLSPGPTGFGPAPRLAQAGRGDRSTQNEVHPEGAGFDSVSTWVVLRTAIEPSDTPPPFQTGERVEVESRLPRRSEGVPTTLLPAPLRKLTPTRPGKQCQVLPPGGRKHRQRLDVPEAAHNVLPR